ncbi:hypothetical protein [Paenibacillus sp. LPE1-1-1.1]|uniref:hypothetical protein n=1 Tax=Paenibacillus sp. LPE1-1-1.1 TaxID=3135230 RepID=UPI003433B1A2
MAYHKKSDYLMDYDADIKVIQECSKDSLMESHIWFGDSPLKGIGIGFKHGINFNLASCYTQSYKWIIPIEVQTNEYDFILIAVWLKRDKKYAYVGPFIQAMKYYLPILSGKKLVIIGDFNSNSIWDQKYINKGNHSEMINLLNQNEISSLYHTYFNEKYGKETKFTYYHKRNPSSGFHLDYCFISNDLLNRIGNFDVGKRSDWIDKSDHVPLIITLN